MKHTIRPDGRNHSMPRSMSEFFGRLESLEGVEAVDSGRFMPRAKVKDFEAKVQFYDESRRTFRLKVCSPGFISYPGIRVSVDAKEEVENYIRNYNSNDSRTRNLPVVLDGSYQELNQTEGVRV